MRCVHLSSWILCKLSFMRLQSDNCKHVYHLTFYKSKHWKLLCQGTLINFNKHANTEDAISSMYSRVTLLICDTSTQFYYAWHSVKQDNHQ